MSASSQCPQCGYDLSNAPQTGAAAGRCPGCGGTVALSPAGGRKPPAPPRRAAPQPQAAQAQAAPQAQPAAPQAAPSNPFQAPPASAPVQPESSAAANPFLEAESVGPVTAQPQPTPSQPRVIPPAQGAPLVAHPGVEAPFIKDAHAEFRKGGWKRPALFAGIAVVLLGALFVMMPKVEEELVDQEALMRPTEGVIGGQLAPGRTALQADKRDSSEHRAAFAETEQAARQDEAGGGPAPERPADIPSQDRFAEEFKEASGAEE